MDVNLQYFAPSTHTIPRSKTAIPSTTPARNSSSTTVTVKSTHRSVSNSSVVQDSAGGARVWASNEKSSDYFANIFLHHVISSIWPDGIILDWVQGRKGDTDLVWSSKDANAVLTMGKGNIMAKTNGSLQIRIPDDRFPGGKILWNRQYYAIPLEAKRYFREGKEKEIGEITNLENSVFAGQIFAEMLAGICHEEFYNQSDQEAFAIFITHTSFQLYHATFPPAYLKYIHDTDYEQQNITTGITLSSTKLYDFCDPKERGEWLDVVIALIEYLRSGESKVGFLNKSLERNMFHKSGEGDVDVDVDGKSCILEEVVDGDTTQVLSGIKATEEGNVATDDITGGIVRRSSRKRGLMEVTPLEWDTKVRRKT